MGGQVPAALTETLTPTLVRMRGTDHTPPRCAALSGKVGSEVRCGIHPWRPSPCRELEAGSDACQRARAHHRLPALS